MKRCLLLPFFSVFFYVTSFIVVLPVEAVPIFYTAEANFQADSQNAGIGLTIESFETLLPGSLAPITVGDVTITKPDDNNVGVDNDISYATLGNQSIGWIQSGTGPIIFTFKKPINSFGIDVIDLGNYGGPSSLTLTTTMGEEVLFQDFIGENMNVLFAGVIDLNDAFISVAFSSTNRSDWVNFDRLQFGAVPEPATMLLLGLGLVGLAGVSRKKFKK